MRKSQQSRRLVDEACQEAQGNADDPPETKGMPFILHVFYFQA